MEEYKVESLGEYLSTIEKLDSNYIFRGQNNPYYRILSTGLRNYDANPNYSNNGDVKKLKVEFYNRVVSKLSDNEKKYFPAFCQHYGLPTNLVDFTFSPLVSLFFSCYGKKEKEYSLENILHCSSSKVIAKLEDDDILNTIKNNFKVLKSKNFYTEYAIVYLIKLRRIIDVTPYVNENDDIMNKILGDFEMQKYISNQIYQRFEDDFEFTKEALFNIISSLKRHIKNNNFIYNKTEFDKILSMLRTIDVDAITKMDERAILNLSDNFQSFFLENLDEFNVYKELFVINKIPSMYYNIAITYATLLLSLLKVIKDNLEHEYFEIDFYFSYQPPNIFTRISNQKSLFVFQPYFNFFDSYLNPLDILAIQNIKHDAEIRVHNYDKILGQLFDIGYDLEFIYGDYDSVAKDVKYKIKRNQ